MVMKFSKYTGGALDAHNGSSMIGRVSLNTRGYNFEDDYTYDNDNILPDITLDISDCSRRVSIHDFGNTKEDMLVKVDRMIDILQEFRSNAIEVWDVYGEFWAKKSKKRYY
jgi:hypothetical protein